MFECPICKNKNPRYIGIRNGKQYCRKCIQFLKDEEVVNDSPNLAGRTRVEIRYPLSLQQERCSDEILKNFIEGKNSLVHAVCGAGKTELVFKVIQYALDKNFNVGFAIPRKDVVIEIASRLERAFSNAKVNYVCGGNTNDLTGNITCLTTHQLYRYEKYFDLLIMDEIDAFPYKDNPVLIEMFKRSVKGNYVLMSATPSKSILEEFKKGNNVIVKLYKRYHGKPLPVPKIIISHFLFQIDKLVENLKRLINDGKQIFVFVPTISECERLFKIVVKMIKKGDYVHSKRENRANIIQNFRDKKIDYLITTAVLERGVTVENLQVIIFKSDHKIYNTSALIQIAGRVGRTIDCPFGEVIYIADKETTFMRESIDEIKRLNTFL